MIQISDDISAEYIQGLSGQKNVYEKILSLSHEETDLLKDKSMPINMAIEILHRKEELLNDIHRIEQRIIGIRQNIADNNIDIKNKKEVSAFIKDIGVLLEELIKTDSLNEHLLRQRIAQSIPLRAPARHVINAYGGYSK